MTKKGMEKKASAKPVDLSAVLADAPRNCWLALNEDETAIVGRGETIEDALAEARRARVEDPVIMWSPKDRIPSVMHPSDLDTQGLDF